MPVPVRPFVHLNLALTHEGLLNAADGSRLPISCDVDWRRVHSLREQYDAVAVGAVTWRRDAPRLTARRERLGREPRRQPERVIFAGHWPCDVELDGRRTFVVGSAPPGPETAARAVLFIPEGTRRLAAPLHALLRQSVRSLLVEGGRLLLTSFLSQRCFDLVTAYVATECPDTALHAARTALPGLPALRASRCGAGMLLSSDGHAAVVGARGLPA
jgi:riboflavin biosynthesis pyrimidine reductase